MNWLDKHTHAYFAVGASFLGATETIEAALSGFTFGVPISEALRLLLYWADTVYIDHNFTICCFGLQCPLDCPLNINWLGNWKCFGTLSLFYFFKLGWGCRIQREKWVNPFTRTPRGEKKISEPFM